MPQQNRSPSEACPGTASAHVRAFFDKGGVPIHSSSLTWMLSQGLRMCMTGASDSTNAVASAGCSLHGSPLSSLCRNEGPRPMRQGV
eukprot:262543-Chlamydomonas_euryale.AAC.1